MTAAVPAAKQRQPAGVYLLFGVEMWERFSFYGMRAFLALFAADATRGGLGWSQASASRLMSFYALAAYSLPVLGGWLADRFWGTHRTMTVGALIIAAGHFTLALPTVPTFFLGLALVAIGTGFFKVNASTMVGQLYQQGDKRRDAGFTIFYMGTNAGAFFGQIICSYFAESPRWGWHWGFGSAGVGMLAGIITYLALKPKFLAGIGGPPDRATRAAARVAAPLTREERDRLTALLALFAFTIVFWMAFEQASTSLNFFAQDKTDRMVRAFQVPAGWFQSVNPVVIVLAAPFFAALWTGLARRGREPSTPMKMAMGLVLVGVGFVFMVFGARRAEGGALVSPWWLVAAYSFHTFGELCLSPIGLSFVTKVAPERMVARLMGVWFFATALGEFLAGQFAALAEKIARGEVFRLLGGEADFFLVLVVFPIAVAIPLVLMTPWLRRQMHGRDV
ncbi:MAG TPA: peptide MFS transporter [Polyangia bacterium]|jgi:POT family proton-dependent oligopeptide transporter